MKTKKIENKNIIAFIGIGGIGFRHLESCVQLSKENYSLHVVDINKEYLNKIATAFPQRDIFLYEKIEELPSEIDICIVATQANIRATLVSNLIHLKKIRHLVLEKVLFQAFEDYSKIEQLLKEYNVEGWVNCPRRMWKAYRDLCHLLKDQHIMLVEVEGKNWDLGCNAIHFIDLISFLNGSSSYRVVKSNFPFAPQESKRKGNYIVNGEIEGYFDDVACRFLVSSTKGSETSKIIRIKTQTGVDVLIKENIQEIEISNIFGTPKKYSIPFQSQLSANLVEQLINFNQCELSSYEISKSLHIPLLQDIYLYLKKYSHELKSCPIT